jgi:hypothetical protein
VPNVPELRTFKDKLANVTEGRPSKLPPTLDLKLLYYDLIGHVAIARQKLNEIQGRRSIANQSLITEFVAALPKDFRWAYLVESGKLTLTDITGDIPSSVSQLILAKTFGVTVEAIHSRLWARKSDV